MISDESENFKRNNEYTVKVRDIILCSISVDELGNILEKEPKINKQKSIENIKVLINYVLTNNDSSLQINNSCKEIGIDNTEFFCLIWLIYISYCKTDKIILKLFNFEIDKFSDYFFEKIKPDVKTLKNYLGINEIHKDNLIIQPINLFDHYSLMLFDNKEIYLIDFGLSHCSDNLKNEKSKKVDKYYNEFLDMLNEKKLNHKYLEIFNIEKENSTDQEIVGKKLEEIVGFKDTNLTTHLIQIFGVEKEIKNTNYLDEDSCQGFSGVFKNNELCQKIRILNSYSIQGEQTCGYFSAAALQYILMNNLNIEKIIDENKDGIFQISVCKIMLEVFMGDNQKIILLNEKIENGNYDVYDNTKNIIAIKKNFQINIKARNDKLLTRLENDEIIDIKTIKTMLAKKGYKKIK